MAGMRLLAAVILVAPVAVMVARCFAADAQTHPSRALPALKDVYKDDFLVGVAIDVTVANGRDQATAALVAQQFNCVTAENGMKWDLLRRPDGGYDFTQADAIVAFAQRHGMTVIGHTLLWHQMTPQWVFQGDDGAPATRELLLSRLTEHIQTVVGRYRGKVRGWDVVNEAIANSGPDELRDSPWRRILGDDYVVEAFRLAAAADPSTELYYNDYNLEDPAKRDKTVRLIRRLQAAGIRVTAVGTQGHWKLQSPTLEEIEKTIQTFAALGVKVNITELDMSLFTKEQTDDRYKDAVPPEVLAKQAARYAAMFEIFRRHRDVIDRVTFWGATDRHSWLNHQPVKGRADHPLLFDRTGQPKPAFWAAIDPAGFLTDPAHQSLLTSPIGSEVRGD
ncbi:MAG: endo-1,4-beta-xylanase [Phycisphaerae bacterium]|nr:endo-1,4-beta-xylanase [Phycisphaerae bacterium]